MTSRTTWCCCFCLDLLVQLAITTVGENAGVKRASKCWCLNEKWFGRGEVVKGATVTKLNSKEQTILYTQAAWHAWA